ncbi:MAG: hypothetical protein HY855_05730 [Burkholderiales bacterium]|nr:hypothetical protein [Burkholderiales bacterium]
MSFSLHRFASLGGYDRSGIRYLWNDTRASLDFTLPMSEAEATVEALRRTSLRARLAFCTALFEVVACRFAPLEADPYPAQLAEAAWCSLADRRLLHYDERPRHQWIGPVRGPLWCAMAWLTPALLFADDDEAEWISAVTYLTRLSHHVVPARAALKDWMLGSIERLATHHPPVTVGPLDDLFGRHAEWRRGPYVGPEAFELDRPYDPAQAPDALVALLGAARHAHNPLLKTAAQWAAEGLGGNPYAAVTPYTTLQP